MLVTLLVGCKLTEPRPAVFTASSQPIAGPREKGYVVCTAALYGAYPPNRLNLQPAYQSGLIRDGEWRLYQLSGWLIEGGRRREVHFECLTEPSRRARLLGLTRVSAPG